MLIDSYNRKHDYLRISLTDKCNLRCKYCIPDGNVKFIPHNEILRIEELLLLIEIFVAQGITKIRFTGGEPLIRKGLDFLLENISTKFPELTLAITTNGILLGDNLDLLHKTGVKKINVSLDSLDPERFKSLTGSDYCSVVKENLSRAIEYNYFDVKVNTVLMTETLDELPSFIDYFLDRNITLRFIELMPLGWSRDLDCSFVTSDQLLSALSLLGKLEKKVLQDTQVAEMYEFTKDSRRLSVGVIPAVSHKFCSKCNRLRLSCDGKLRTCLHSAETTDLKYLLRSNSDIKIIEAKIDEALQRKPAEHNLAFKDNCSYRNCDGCVDMSKIGG